MDSRYKGMTYQQRLEAYQQLKDEYEWKLRREGKAASPDEFDAKMKDFARRVGL